MEQYRGSMAGPPAGANRVNMTSMLAGFALGAVLASLAWVQVVPEETTSPDGAALSNLVPVAPGEVPEGAAGDDGEGGTTRRVIQSGGDGGDGGGAAGGVNVGDGVGGGTGGGSGGGSGGSAASTGVSESEIKLGATYVAEGIAEAFLGEVQVGMEAVRNRVNAEGGVHGRKLEISYANDLWDPDRGLREIQNLVNDGVFAFAVSPSSEGLNAASKTGVFRNNQVPVVGADGLNNTQFTDPWIWPVATATTTQMHIIMKNAAERAGGGGNLHPAIVFGNTYRFGVEGAYAFNAAFCRVTGGSVTGSGGCDGGRTIPGYSPGQQSCNKDSRYCGIKGNEGQYVSQTGRVEDACNQAPKCNFILLLLEPKTAQNWMNDFQIRPSHPDLLESGGMAGAQPLFTNDFGKNCKEACDGMWVWTGYNPPIGEFNSDPQVATYKQELTGQKAGADVNNQFTMGGYVGMELLWQALDAVGPDLTRDKLVSVLNGGIQLDTGLTAGGALAWSENQRYANDAAHSYEMRWNFDRDTFTGFQRTNTGYVEDDWLGEDNQVPGG